MIILTKRIELPDNATWDMIEDAKITADRNGWKREHTISQQERMLKTDLEGKCGSCKYFNLKPDLFSCCYGDCSKGRAGYRPRSQKACKAYERKDDV